MNNQELKAALLDERTVKYTDCDSGRYKVSGIIYRKNEYTGKIYVTVELQDLKANSVCIVNPMFVKEAENGET